MEGVVRAPSAFSMTLGAEPSMTATQELVVPRSIPITFAILRFLSQAMGSWPSRGAFRPIPLNQLAKPALGETHAGPRGYIGRAGRGRKAAMLQSRSSASKIATQ